MKIVLLVVGLIAVGSVGTVGASKLPISEAERKQIMGRGIVSGHGERCGLDWRELNFFPMMRYWRGQGKTEQQMAVIGALHGAAQAQAKASGSSCTADDVGRLREQLKFKP